jgi:DNA-binding NarL/FixJ family response regulator
MSELPDAASEAVAKDSQTQQRAKVILLNSKQWLYVQHRYDLTPRERQIAELICQGLRNGRIAKYLRIQPGTVKTHIRNIYRKVRVKSKIAMLLRFIADAKELSPEYDGIPVPPRAMRITGDSGT